MRRFCIVAVLAAAGVFVTPAAAWAHAELVSSDPGYGDRLAAAPAEVRLEFSGADGSHRRPCHAAAQGGQGRSAASQAGLAPTGGVVSVALPPDSATGAYTMVWFFLGNDGHLMGGEVAFVGRRCRRRPSLPKVAAPEARRPQRQVRTLGPGIAGPAVQLDAVDPAAPGSEAAPVHHCRGHPQAIVRLLDYASLADPDRRRVLPGPGVEPPGVGERRARRLLWWALLGSAVATLLDASA